MVDSSPWPILASFSLFSLIFSSFLIFSSNQTDSSFLLIFWMSIVGFSMICYQWWRDVSRESVYQGHHSSKVVIGLKSGIIMFILSEIMFFFSFFFAYFCLSLNPDVELGMKWPPEGLQSLSFLSVPLLNTIILLSSGISITWAHHSLLGSNLSSTTQGMVWTILLGLIFTLFQGAEYFESNFTMSDGAYGSIFFIATGFHGIHVLIGTIFILISCVRIMKFFMTSKNHLGFEMAAWYWHFVDVVWLFLFISIYWWGA